MLPETLDCILFTYKKFPEFSALTGKQDRNVIPTTTDLS